MNTVYLTDAFAVLGAVYSVCTVLASVLPAGKVKTFFATVALDVTKLQSAL